MTKIAGRYEIRAKLGEGGMGVVFRAYDPPPVDREVAVKTLHELSDPFARELFYKECAALKSISHPNICEIFDIGEYEDGGHTRPFFVMPLLPGQTLDDLIRKASHRLTVERVVEIFAQTCRGLQAAHDHGLVHRDLKPSNLFVMADDSVKIIDFGVAHAVQARSQLSSYDKGTLLYMAPEQVQRKAVSAQSDIYSLGVTLYEALTRRQPFKHPTEDAVIQAITKQIPPPASDLNPAVSQIISRVVHKAMAKQPWNRFDTAREFGETLQKAARNEPIALFDPARTQPRIETAMRNLEKGDFQFADEIVTELEAEGNIDPQITLLRAQIDQIARQKTVGQLLESARARFEEQEDPLALQKIQEVLQLDPTNVGALSLKSRIEDRRSERQIEKWIQLAQQHSANRSYAHAREALQNALALRPKDVRASRLLKEVEREEQDYLRLRKEKSELYQSAVNAWQNGEVSQALSQMRVVLDLDRQAPDASSPETANAYQSFYNKIRSEHDAMNNAYAEARRCLADKEFAKATQICVDYLVKYPGQALFQALKFDIEEQQRQRLSSFVAEIDRRLDAEADLEAKLSLVREAVEEFPEEEHFKRLLRMHQDKRDLVNSIAERARLHESGGQITEALNDLETLGTIYAAYPGLKFEKDRVRKRLEQQTRDSARAKWIKQIDGQLEAGDYEAADVILAKAELEFPGDADLAHFRSVSAEGAGRAKRAELLAAEGQQLCEQGRFDEGVAQLRAALQLDERSSVRLTLRDLLASHAQQLFETDWREADKVVDQVLELDPKHPLAKSLRARALDRRREETISQSGSRARRLQAEGKTDEALHEIEKGLADNPGDSRLALIADSIKKDRARIVPVPGAASPTWSPGSSDPGSQDPGLQETHLAPTTIKTSAPGPDPSSGGLERTTVKTPVPRPDAGLAPEPPDEPMFERTTISTPVLDVDAGNTRLIERADLIPPPIAPTARQTPRLLRDADATRPAAGVNTTLVGAAVGVALLLAAIWFVFLRGGSTPPATTATLALRNWPADVAVIIDGQEAGRTSADGTLTVEVAPGRHALTFGRANYYPETVERELSAGQTDEIGARTINWRSVPPPAPPPPPPPPGPTTSLPTTDPTVTTPPPTTGTLRLLGWPVGVGVMENGVLIDRVKDSRLTVQLSVGNHTLVFQREGYEPEQRPVTIKPGINLDLSAAGIRWRSAPVTPAPVPPGPTTTTTTAPPPPPPPAPPVGAIVRIVTEPNARVTIKNPDGTVASSFTGPQSVKLAAGTYRVEAIGPESFQMEKPGTLTVNNGDPQRDYQISYVAGIAALAGTWKPANGFLTLADAKPVFIDRATTGGHIVFTAKVDERLAYQGPFQDGARLAWVVGYVNEQNQIVYELGADTLVVRQIVNGQSHVVMQKRHGIDVARVVAISLDIDLSRDTPVTNYQLIGRGGSAGNWIRLDGGQENYTRPALPAGSRFGFLPSAPNKITIKDFRYHPAPPK